MRPKGNFRLSHIPNSLRTDFYVDLESTKFQ
jgi:hypothetical protein